MADVAIHNLEQLTLPPWAFSKIEGYSNDYLTSILCNQ